MKSAPATFPSVRGFWVLVSALLHWHIEARTEPAYHGSHWNESHLLSEWDQGVHTTSFKPEEREGSELPGRRQVLHNYSLFPVERVSLSYHLLSLLSFVICFARHSFLCWTLQGFLGFYNLDTDVLHILKGDQVSRF